MKVCEQNSTQNYKIQFNITSIGKQIMSTANLLFFCYLFVFKLLLFFNAYIIIAVINLFLSISFFIISKEVLTSKLLNPEFRKKVVF